MRVRISRLVSSYVFKYLGHFPETCSSFNHSTREILSNHYICPASHNFCPTTTYFSTISNRPMRGNRTDQDEELRQNFGFKDEDLNQNHEDPNPQNKKPEISPDSTENAEEIFKKMKETGLIPNAVAMLDGLCKDGLIQEAMKLFGLMREKGTIPEVVIYTAVVDGFCKASEFEDAKRIFKKMQNNGIVPNAFSYTLLIQGLCKGGQLDDSLKYCIEMLEAGHLPNVTTFTILIDGFCRERGIEEAENAVGQLREKGFALDEKAVREHLEKKGPFPPSVWEVIFGKKNTQRVF